MTDKQQENKINDDILSKNDNNTVITVNKCQEQKTSKGEKVFNWATYTGLNYVVNLILSVATADYFINGKGRNKLDNWINTLTNKLNKISVPIKTAHHHSKIGLETLILTSGGLFLLAPLKLLEDNKRPIVHWINKKLGVNQKAADGHEKTPDEIHIEKEQPKQSWGHVIWRRIEATIAVVGIGLGLDHFARDKYGISKAETYDLGWTKITYDAKVKGGKQVVEEKAFAWIDRVAHAVRGKKCVEGGTVNRWTRLAILDSVFTGISALVMKITNGAKKGKMPQEIDDSNDPIVIDDSINKITTADMTKKNHQLFIDKVEKRVDALINFKHKNTNRNFVQDLQQKDNSIVSIGI